MKLTDDLLEELVEEEKKVRQHLEELGVRIKTETPKQKEEVSGIELIERELAQSFEETRNIYTTDNIVEHTEIKFKIDSFARIEKKLQEVGAQLISREFIRTLRFDDVSNSISKMGASLRLRKGSRNKLTLKVKMYTEKGVRTSKKLTVNIDNIQVMKDILSYLGYNVCQRVEQYRICYQYGDSVIHLDILPMGNFVEIVGKKENIIEIAEILNLDMGDCLGKHYGEIWNEYCGSRGINQEDIVFF